MIQISITEYIFREKFPTGKTGWVKGLSAKWLQFASVATIEQKNQMMLSLFFAFSCLIFPETSCLPQYWPGHHLLVPRLTPYSYYEPPAGPTYGRPGLDYRVLPGAPGSHLGSLAPWPGLDYSLLPGAPGPQLVSLAAWPGLGRRGVQTPPDDILTSSGLRIELLRTSVVCTHRVMAGDRLTVHYTGHLDSTGEQFDSSVGGEPISVVIGEGRLIQGWEEGLTDRCEGDQLRLIVPPHLGYGEEGKRRAGDGGEEEPTEEFVIPPDSTLIFRLDLVKVQPAML